MTVAKPLSSGLEEYRREFLAAGQPGPVIAARTRAVDALVLEAYERELAPALPQPFALLAVGGYGRRQLFPHSDVDLMILVEKGSQATSQRDALQAFLRGLWDAGLRLGHSVHTVEECLEIHLGNLELSISLLDQRFLAGDAEFHQRFQKQLTRFFYGQKRELIRQLCLAARTRHAKYHTTVYHLEPNIKESPGGLRDSQVIQWLARLQDAAPEHLPESSYFPELDSAFQFLATARVFLHLETGRDSNQLTFELQERLAELPFFALDTAGWMRRYLHHTREIYRVAIRSLDRAEEQTSGLFQAFRAWRSRLSTADFSVSHERVFLKVPHKLTADPELALRLFQFVARHGIRLAWDTEKRVTQNLEALSANLASGPKPWPAFREILRQPHADLALRTMHETGVLSLFIPAWELIQSLVVRDFYHRYTVDEHTLVTVGILCELHRGGFPEARRLAELLGEIERLDLLYLALLLHDTGKAIGDGRHSSESVRLAEEAMDVLGLPEADRPVVRFLIREHLLLSEAMTSRDLNDPATTQQLAHLVGTPERLGLLTLMTFADVSGVNPHAMTAWRRDQLWRVYVAATRELTRELDVERIHAPDDPASAERTAFLEGLPTRYLQTHSPADTDRHLRLEAERQRHGVGLDLRREEGYYAAELVASDRPFLFAGIAGVLSSFGLDILKAEAFANAAGVVLDTFVFSDPHRNLDLNPPEVDHLRVKLRRAALGKLNIQQLLQSRPPAKPPSRKGRIEPRVRIDSSVSHSSTLVEVVAQDRPGLLYDLASAISEVGCNIEVVLIDTQAHRAFDVFYLTSGGGKLPDYLQQELRDNLLEACSP